MPRRVTPFQMESCERSVARPWIHESATNEGRLKRVNRLYLGLGPRSAEVLILLDDVNYKMRR